MVKQFNSLVYKENELVFGKARNPLRLNGMVIGGGTVIPEINFTLPSMAVNESTMPEVRKEYKEIMTAVCQRAVDLYQKELVVEFELVPQMTFQPEWGGELTAILKSVLGDFEAKHGLKSAIRATIVDIRETQAPPLKRKGPDVETMFKSFQLCAQNGADLLAIESTGGKEVTDKALLMADLNGMMFGLGILAPADMSYLWGRICQIASETKTIASGDTACGFGNTAMVLADRMYIPKVFATIVRVLTIVRSLAAYEAGAVGPGKDCGYENPYIKAITGYPMSMEGKSAACAHLSSLGNIASAYADLWSNESVQDIKLLSGMAPVVSMEQLIYDCRLMNLALRDKKEILLRDWLVESDAPLDPQAYIFTPHSVIEIARTVIAEKDDYRRCLAAGRKAYELVKKAADEKKVLLSPVEAKWLGKIEVQLDDFPEDRGTFISQEKEKWAEFVNFGEYGI